MYQVRIALLILLSAPRPLYALQASGQKCYTGEDRAELP